MYHHHPAWRKLGQHPAICQVVASLYGGTESVQMLSDGVWMKPAGGLGATLHQVRTTACARAPRWAVPRLSALSLLPLSCPGHRLPNHRGSLEAEFDELLDGDR